MDFINEIIDMIKNMLADILEVIRGMFDNPNPLA